MSLAGTTDIFLKNEFDSPMLHSIIANVDKDIVVKNSNEIFKTILRQLATEPFDMLLKTLVCLIKNIDLDTHNDEIMRIAENLLQKSHLAYYSGFLLGVTCIRSGRDWRTITCSSDFSRLCLMRGILLNSKDAEIYQEIIRIVNECGDFNTRTIGIENLIVCVKSMDLSSQNLAEICQICFNYWDHGKATMLLECLQSTSSEQGLEREFVRLVLEYSDSLDWTKSLKCDLLTLLVKKIDPEIIQERTSLETVFSLLHDSAAKRATVFLRELFRYYFSRYPSNNMEFVFT